MTLRMEAGAGRKTYKIGQAAKLLDVKPFVLRFWEGEFKGLLVPVRTPSGQRAYTEQNVETVREIKRLLYDEGLTIEGAKKRLREAASQGQRSAPVASPGVPAPSSAASASSLPAPAPSAPGPSSAASGTAAYAPAAPRPAQPSLLDPPQAQAAPAAATAPAADPDALRRAEDRAQALRAALADVLSELRSLRVLLG